MGCQRREATRGRHPRRPSRCQTGHWRHPPGESQGRRCSRQGCQRRSGTLGRHPARRRGHCCQPLLWPAWTGRRHLKPDAGVRVGGAWFGWVGDSFGITGVWIAGVGIAGVWWARAGVVTGEVVGDGDAEGDHVRDRGLSFDQRDHGVGSGLVEGLGASVFDELTSQSIDRGPRSDGLGRGQGGEPFLDAGFAGPPPQAPIRAVLLRPRLHCIGVDRSQRGLDAALEAGPVLPRRVLDQSSTNGWHEVFGHDGSHFVIDLVEFVADDLGPGFVHDPVGHRGVHRRQRSGEFVGAVHPMLRGLLRHTQRPSDQRGGVQPGVGVAHRQVQQGPVFGFHGVGVRDRGDQLHLTSFRGVDEAGLVGEFSDEVGQRGLRQPGRAARRVHVLLSPETVSNTSARSVEFAYSAIEFGSLLASRRGLVRGQVPGRRAVGRGRGELLIGGAGPSSESGLRTGLGNGNGGQVGCLTAYEVGWEVGRRAAHVWHGIQTGLGNGDRSGRTGQRPADRLSREAPGSRSGRGGAPSSPE